MARPLNRAERKTFRADLYAGFERQANVVGHDAVKHRALSKSWKPWAWMLTKQEKAWAILELVAEKRAT